MNLIHRNAVFEDLEKIIKLLSEDILAKERESDNGYIDEKYIKAFTKIASDANQYLMVVENYDEMVATCHLTLIPSLTYMGSIRLNIEAVRVQKKYRSRNIGEWMINEAINWGKDRGAKIIQLSTNKKRESAIKFYKKIGFNATHEGMKLFI